MRSSVSIKTESAYVDQGVEDEHSGDDMSAGGMVAADVADAAARETDAAETGGDDSDQEDVILVASDLVPPAAPEARQSTSTATATAARDDGNRRHSLIPGGNTPRCEICKKQKQKVSNDPSPYLPFYLQVRVSIMHRRHGFKQKNYEVSWR